MAYSMTHSIQPMISLAQPIMDEATRELPPTALRPSTPAYQTEPFRLNTYHLALKECQIPLQSVSSE